MDLRGLDDQETRARVRGAALIPESALGMVHPQSRDKETAMESGERRVPREAQDGVWFLTEGDLRLEGRPETYRPDGTENLTYNNPYAITVERVWFDGKLVFALDSGEVEVEFDENRVAVGNKVAQEYQLVHSVELDERGKWKDGQEPEYVEGQYNIYDSVPGMENYSPIWQFNYVVVPPDYEPNTLRSEEDCLRSGYRIEKSTVAEN